MSEDAVRIATEALAGYTGASTLAASRSRAEQGACAVVEALTAAGLLLPGPAEVEQAWRDGAYAGSGAEARWACQDCVCGEFTGSPGPGARQRGAPAVGSRCRCGHWWDRHSDEPPGAGADPFGRTAQDWERHAE